MSGARRPLVEILYFDGCPNHEPAVALVERLSRELGIEPELALVEVPDQQEAQRQRFLGSPTIRVGGVDVDPYSDERRDYGLACRVFRTEQGMKGLPDEHWLREALQRESGRCEDPAPERTRRLSAPQRRLYRWILERFAAAETPDAAALGEAAARLGLDTAGTLATLAREDLVHLDEQGAVAVAYPFSASARGHRVLIDDRRTVEAMCAIDALGIAAMLELPIEVTSRDPTSGTEIWVRVEPGDGAGWEPQSAVVLAASSGCEGPSFRTCCDFVNFFDSADSAQRYLDSNRDVSGVPISIPEAIEAGRAVFGDILEEAS